MSALAVEVKGVLQCADVFLQAAEHVQMLTRALAHQPYKFKVIIAVGPPLLNASL